MRIAICTRLRIPIFICNRANSSSFASCGMRQLCADAEDVALVWQNEHRHAVKTTESGHKRSSTHGGKENLVAHHDLSLWSFILEKTFCTSNLIISVISIHWYKYSVISWKQALSQAHRWNVIEAHIEGLMADIFLKYNPEWGRRRTVQVVRRAQGRGESRIHPDVSQWLQQWRHGTEICHWSWVPSTPTIDIHKNFYPIVFLFFSFSFYTPEKYNYLISGSKKNTINNTNKIKTVARHEESITNRTVLRLSQQGLMGSAVHGTCSGEAWCVRPALATKCFPELLLQHSLSLYANELKSSQWNTSV